jgi:hypothetical protein
MPDVEVLCYICLEVHTVILRTTTDTLFYNTFICSRYSLVFLQISTRLLDAAPSSGQVSIARTSVHEGASPRGPLSHTLSHTHLYAKQVNNHQRNIQWQNT